MHATAAAIGGEASLVVFEGPRTVLWEHIVDTFAGRLWKVTTGEFLTTEFGEAAARRRVCVVAAPDIEVEDALDSTTSRGRLAAPAGAVLAPTRDVGPENWIFPDRTAFDAGIPRESLVADPQDPLLDQRRALQPGQFEWPDSLAPQRGSRGAGEHSARSKRPNGCA